MVGDTPVIKIVVILRLMLEFNSGNRHPSGCRVTIE